MSIFFILIIYLLSSWIFSVLLCLSETCWINIQRDWFLLIFVMPFFFWILILIGIGFYIGVFILKLMEIFYFFKNERDKI